MLSVLGPFRFVLIEAIQRGKQLNPAKLKPVPMNDPLLLDPSVRCTIVANCCSKAVIIAVG